MKLLKEVYDINQMLKEFLSQPDIQGYMNSYKFKEVYAELNFAGLYGPELTDLLQHIGIDIDNYIDSTDTETAVIAYIDKVFDHRKYLPHMFKKYNPSTNFTIVEESIGDIAYMLEQSRYCDFGENLLTDFITNNETALVDDFQQVGYGNLESLTIEDFIYILDKNSDAYIIKLLQDRGFADNDGNLIENKIRENHELLDAIMDAYVTGAIIGAVEEAKDDFWEAFNDILPTYAKSYSVNTNSISFNIDVSKLSQYEIISKDFYDYSDQNIDGCILNDLEANFREIQFTEPDYNGWTEGFDTKEFQAQLIASLENM